MAVDIPEAARSELGLYIAGCQPRTPGFRWAPPANLHLTVRFCGGLDDAGLAALQRELRSVRVEPFDVGLGGVSTFGGGRPRVIWLQVGRGADELRSLAAAVERACRGAGIAPDDRPFRAHLTLARAAGRERVPMPALPPPPELPAWRVTAFTLYESRLGRGPAAYSVIEEFPLSPGS